MAVFSTNTLGNLNQIEDKKIQSYLYKLNEDLTYMFNNLTPEDNYSKEALNVYASNSQMVAEMSVTVDGINATVTDNVNNYNSTLSVLANCLSLTNSTPAGASSAVLSGDKITLTTGKFLVNSKNLTIDASGNATFSGKLSAATGTFKGSLSAATGTFSGELEAASGTFDEELSSVNGCIVLRSVADKGRSAVIEITNPGDSETTQITGSDMFLPGDLYCRYVYCEDVEFNDYQNSVMYWIDWLYDQIA